MTVLDLSATGIGFSIDEPLEVGEKIQLRIQLPSAQSSLEIFAIVRQQHAESLRVGAEFTDVTPTQAAAIDSLVQFVAKPPPPTP